MFEIGCLYEAPRGTYFSYDTKGNVLDFFDYKFFSKSDIFLVVNKHKDYSFFANPGDPIVLYKMKFYTLVCLNFPSVDLNSYFKKVE